MSNTTPFLPPPARAVDAAGQRRPAAVLAAALASLCMACTAPTSGGAGIFFGPGMACNAAVDQEACYLQGFVHGRMGCVGNVWVSVELCEADHECVLILDPSTPDESRVACEPSEDAVATDAAAPEVVDGGPDGAEDVADGYPDSAGTQSADGHLPDVAPGPDVAAADPDANAADAEDAATDAEEDIDDSGCDACPNPVEDTGPITACPGGIGCACVLHSDCKTDLCLIELAAPICSKACIESCPDGFACKPIVDKSGDSFSACLPVP